MQTDKGFKHVYFENKSDQSFLYIPVLSTQHSYFGILLNNLPFISGL